MNALEKVIQYVRTVYMLGNHNMPFELANEAAAELADKDARLQAAEALVGEVYEIHLCEHTATADFEVCQNERCKMANKLEAALKAVQS